MKLYLIVAHGKHQGLPIAINIDLFMMGSDKICQLRSVLPGIGPRHCALVTRDGKVFLRDLDSGSATLINGEMVPPGDEWPLHAGDRLALGPLEFVVQFREKPLSQRDLEEWALKCLDVTSEREIDEPDQSVVQLSKKAINAAEAAASILDKLQAKRGLVKGRLRVGREQGVTIIRFNDIYLVDESEIALVNKELHENLNKPNLRVLLDCKNVKRLSTAAIKMIDDLSTWLRPWGSSLALCRVRPDLQGILTKLDLTNTIPHFDDKNQALLTFW